MAPDNSHNTARLADALKARWLLGLMALGLALLVGSASRPLFRTLLTGSFQKTSDLDTLECRFFRYRASIGYATIDPNRRRELARIRYHAREAPTTGGQGTMSLLQDKVGLVTGAGAGIGRATAITFARDGAKVAVVDCDGDAGRQTVRHIQELGGQAVFIEADVSEAGQVEAMVSETISSFGALHCASNNAAQGSGFHHLTDIEPAKWQRALDVSLNGVWLCMKHEIPAMLESGGGSIVNIASVSGMRGESLQAAYSAAKGGVIALTKTAAAEYAQRGIRVNALCPGGVRTRSIEKYFRDLPGIEERTVATHAMRRLAEPEEIADVVSFLCSDRSSFVTGHVMVADGGILVNSHFL